MALVSTMFAIYRAAFRAAPFANAEHLHAITEVKDRASAGFSVVSRVTVEAIRHGARSFATVAASRNHREVVQVAGNALPVGVTEVDTAIFRLLGARPLIGRLPSQQEIVQRAPVAVISERLASILAPNANLIGFVMRLRSGSYEVIGIMPRGFSFPERSDAWIPLDESAASTSYGDSESLSVIGELRDGVQVDVVKQELRSLVKQLRETDSRYYRGMELVLRDEAIDRRTLSWKPVLDLFLALAACVMLVSCVNVGNLLVMRSTERRSEFALRMVLGATRLRVVRQIAVESAIISAIAAIGGAVLTVWFLELADRVLPLASMPGWFQLTADIRVFALLSATAVVAIGITSSSASRPVRQLDLSDELKGGTQTATARGVSRTGERAVLLQVALCTSVSVVAFILIGAYQRVAQMPLGYDRGRLLRAYVDLDPHQYRDSIAWQSANRAVSARLMANPLIESEARESAFSGFSDLAYKRGLFAEVFRLDDPSHSVSGDLHPALRMYAVSDQYFRTLGISLLAGRGFGPSDTLGSPKVAIVSHRLAKALYGDDSPIGRSMRVGNQGPVVSVIGVVSDTRVAGTATLAVAQLGTPIAYFSDRQVLGGIPQHWIRVRGTLGDAAAAAIPEIRAAVPGLNSVAVQPAAESEGALVLRVVAGVLSVTSGIGLLITVLGIYAVAQYAVVQRLRTFGIQLALGASPNRVYIATMKRGLRVIAGGLFLGLVGGALLEVAIRPEAWGMARHSPMLYVGVAGLFLVVGVIAGHRAALISSQIEPASALRV